MVTICGRNSDDMFYLTRDGDIEITLVGFHPYKIGGLYHYAWQSICAYSKEEFDEFGRNDTDRLFIRFCQAVFNIVPWNWEGKNMFKFLSCKKDGDKYIARLELSDETLEMELAEIVVLLEQRLQEGYYEN